MIKIAKGLFTAIVALAIAAMPALAAAQVKEVKVALIAPFSGPWARQGDLMLKGAQMAVDDINAQGSRRWAARR